MPKMTLDFEGFDEVIQQMERLNGDIKKTAERALRETHAIVTPGVQTAMTRHRDTGQTAGAIVTSPDIRWVGDRALVPVGFRVRQGGLASIFLMFGTPRQRPRKAVWRRIFGRAVVNQVRAEQERIFYEEIRRLERG